MINYILAEIKAVNNARKEDAKISSDESNEEILAILERFDLIDNENLIAEKLGLDSLHLIRDAEQGIYPAPSNLCKLEGLKSLAEVVELTETSEQTLINWSKNKPKLFAVTVIGAAGITRSSDC